MKYKVEHIQDNIYQVLKEKYRMQKDTTSTAPIFTEIFESWTVVLKGTLPECEAWINLKEKGYL